jgi:hypothetical protein
MRWIELNEGKGESTAWLEIEAMVAWCGDVRPDREDFGCGDGLVMGTAAIGNC